MKIALISIVVSFFITFILMKLILPLLKKLKAGQYILGYVKEHENKQGTPTMGGLAFVAAIIISAIIFYGFDNGVVNFTLSITAAFAIVGFIDDFIKISKKDNLGLKAYQKIIFQSAIALTVGLFCYFTNTTQVYIPFFAIKLNIGLWCVPCVAFVFVATVNCVNLCDGLDGLASSTALPYLLSLGIIIFVEADGLSTACFLGVGAMAAFLIFNVNKASVFMGDTGSLALGGYIACLSCFSSNALYIPIIGIMFVVSGMSVILQVIYYKKTRKRLFLMAPIHHHFQMKGISESKISYYYCTITSLLGIICILFVV